jgi:hypothetical protein
MKRRTFNWARVFGAPHPDRVYLGGIGETHYAAFQSGVRGMTL